MAATLRRLLLAITLAATAASAAPLGSIVSSFLLRDSMSQPVTSGMEYADGFLWTLQMDSPGASLVKRSFPSGSILSSSQISGDDVLYSCLAYDGQYFWAGCCDWFTYANQRLLKISPATMSVIASVSLCGDTKGQIMGLAWEDPYFWFSYHGSANCVYRLSTSGSFMASFAVPYGHALGVACAPALGGGTRLFEGYDSGGDDMIAVWKGPGHESEYDMEMGKNLNTALAACWDGDYLWVIEPGTAVNYAYRVVAWPPAAALAPASVGRVKAIFR